MTELIKKARQTRRRNIESSNTSFRSAAVKGRKMDELIGLVKGLLADKKLPIEEVKFLKNWIESNPAIRREANEIYQRISSVETLDSKEEKQIKNFLDEVNEPGAIFDETDELIGLVKGLLADKKLPKEEIVFLRNWLKKNREIRKELIGKAIYQQLSSVKEIDSEEETQLKNFLEKVIGGSPDAIFDGEAEKPTELAFNTEEDIKIEIQSKTFCLSGEFIYGKRKEIEDEIELLGGIVKSGVSSKVDYLVVGTYSSKEWMHSSFGRKIEKAKELGIMVIRERNLEEALQTLRDTPNKDGSGGKGNKRIPLESISFEDTRDESEEKYVTGWFFWVHEAFKPQLDIFFVQRVNPKKAKTFIQVETEGRPPLFSFEQGHTMESRCGRWCIQVTQAASDSREKDENENLIFKDGSVGFTLFIRNAPSDQYTGIWKQAGWFSTTQRDFVRLLETGKCDVVDLFLYEPSLNT